MSATFNPTTAVPAGKVHTWAYWERIGVPDIPPSASPFDYRCNGLPVRRA